MVDNNYDKKLFLFNGPTQIMKKKKKKLKLVLKYTKGMKRDWKRTTNTPGVISDTRSPHGNPRSNPTPGTGFFSEQLFWTGSLALSSGLAGKVKHHPYLVWVKDLHVTQCVHIWSSSFPVFSLNFLTGCGVLFCKPPQILFKMIELLRKSLHRMSLNMCVL